MVALVGTKTNWLGLDSKPTGLGLGHTTTWLG